MNTTLPTKTFRILSLDGGGAKGFYTLGILDEIEKNAGKPIHECFDLIFGTSTGAIIAALLARGDSVADIIKTYTRHVPTIMTPSSQKGRTIALFKLGHNIFSKTQLKDFKTAIGIVSTNWKDERPFIFKTSVAQAHGSKGSFVPFWGCSIADAVIASCSAHPYFDTHTVKKSNGDTVELADGGFCANNPTLYAIADATIAMGQEQQNLRVVSLGVGAYPELSIWKRAKRICKCPGLLKHGFNYNFLQKVLGTNTRSMEVLREVLFKNVATIRINDAFVEPEMATDLLEHNVVKLNRLTQKGRFSFAAHEQRLLSFINS